MAKLNFRPDADGFAFVNNFTIDSTERAVLTGIVLTQGPAVAGAVAAVLPVLGPLVPVVAPVLIGVAAGYVAFGTLPNYGLCGGMSYAALDYWRARMPLPRGAHVNDEPVRGTAGDGVRVMLWNRLVDSLSLGGVLAKTVEWMLRLNFMPGVTGGGKWLKQQTLQEWQRLKSHIDQGQPWPIGLVGDTLSAWNQHQVLVYGYEDMGSGARLYICDPNDAHQQGDMSDTFLEVDFSLATNVVVTGRSLQPAIGNVVGFFCSGYTPHAPNRALAPSYGFFVNRSGVTDMMAWGTRLPVAPGEFATLGVIPATVRADNTVGPGEMAAFPRDGVLLQDRTQPHAVLFQGGAPFAMMTAGVLNLFGGQSAVQLVPAGSLTRFMGPPVNDTLLRDISMPEVFRIEGGVKHWVTSPAELQKWGGFASVRLVPPGALNGFPTGSNLGLLPEGFLVQEAASGIWVIAGGAKFHVPDMPTLNRLFPGAAPLSISADLEQAIPTIPVDGTLLREENGAIWVIYGNAKFHVPDVPTLNRLFPGRATDQLWNGALGNIGTLPADGTRLRSESSPQVFVMTGGHKHAAAPGTITQNVLWASAFAAIP